VAHICEAIDQLPLLTLKCIDSLSPGFQTHGGLLLQYFCIPFVSLISLLADGTINYVTIHPRVDFHARDRRVSQVFRAEIAYLS
jgi:hypothetical protein